MKRQSAYTEILKQKQDAIATQEASVGTKTEDSTTALPQTTVIPQLTEKPHEAVKQTKTAQRVKITFYLEPDQASRLDDLVEAFRHRTGVKINQQNLMRRLVETATIDSILP